MLSKILESGAAIFIVYTRQSSNVKLKLARIYFEIISFQVIVIKRGIFRF